MPPYLIDPLHPSRLRCEDVRRHRGPAAGRWGGPARGPDGGPGRAPGAGGGSGRGRAWRGVRGDGGEADGGAGVFWENRTQCGTLKTRAVLRRRSPGSGPALAPRSPHKTVRDPQAALGLRPAVPAGGRPAVGRPPLGPGAGLALRLPRRGAGLPRPDAPSTRWQRTARGLRAALWMRLAGCPCALGLARQLVARAGRRSGRRQRPFADCGEWVRPPPASNPRGPCARLVRAPDMVSDHPVRR